MQIQLRNDEDTILIDDTAPVQLWVYEDDGPVTDFDPDDAEQYNVLVRYRTPGDNHAYIDTSLSDFADMVGDHFPLNSYAPTVYRDDSSLPYDVTVCDTEDKMIEMAREQVHAREPRYVQ